MKINNFLITAPVLSLGLISCSPSALGGQQAVAPASRELTLDRVIAEPDARKPLSMLHWSHDGRRIAWMQPARGSARSGNQQEIWTVSSDSIEAGVQAAASSQPLLLASAASVTNALRGSDAPIPAALSEGGYSSDSPFLLRDFAWSPDGASVLLFGSQSIAWLDISSARWQTVASGEEAIADASLSPDGLSISFIRGHRLCL